VIGEIKRFGVFSLWT